MGNHTPRYAVLRKMTLRRSDGVAYMTRWRLVQTPFFGVYLHKFEAGDPGVDLHDHPWPFATLILRGGYAEAVADVRTAGNARTWRGRTWRAGTVHTIRLDEAHSIGRLLRIPTWTLVLRGRVSRRWGFYEPDGWTESTPYSSARRDLAAEMS